MALPPTGLSSDCATCVAFLSLKLCKLCVAFSIFKIVQVVLLFYLSNCSVVLLKKVKYLPLSLIDKEEN
jgi:hypothetical protein